MNSRWKQSVVFFIVAICLATRTNAASSELPPINKDSVLKTMSSWSISTKLKCLDSLAHLHVQLDVDKNYIETLLQES